MLLETARGLLHLALQLVSDRIILSLSAVAGLGFLHGRHRPMIYSPDQLHYQPLSRVDEHAAGLGALGAILIRGR
jgi:hypothetical protein